MRKATKSVSDGWSKMSLRYYSRECSSDGETGSVVALIVSLHNDTLLLQCDPDFG